MPERERGQVGEEEDTVSAPEISLCSRFCAVFRSMAMSKTAMVPVLGELLV